MRKALMGFVKDEQGTEVLEWGLVCGLIVLGAVAVMVSVGPKVKSYWTGIDNSLTPAP